MNILLLFMRDHPEAVDRLTEGEVVSLDQLIEVIESFRFPVFLDRDLRDALQRWEPLGTWLADAYLPVIENDRWRASLDEAMPSYQEEEELIGTPDWVTFVRGRGSSRGVAVPTDPVPTRRVSLFATNRSGAINRIGVEYGRERFPTGLSLSFPLGCSLPAWGKCHSGECSGDCQLKRVHDDDDGLICRCPHFIPLVRTAGD